MTAIYSYFRGRTVADITASLSGMVVELKSHADAKIAEEGKHIEESNRIRSLALAARDEHVRAMQAAEKIGALFS